MPEMTVREFEYILKHCYVTRCNCEKCPIHNNLDCFPFIVKTAYDIIISQEATLENYQSSNVAPVRHGRWETISDSDLSRTVMCSVCNNTFYYSKRREQLKIDMMPYCPHCGAKMDLKEV